MLQTLNPVPYRFCTLYSGSEGNAAYLETPSARILIDAGRCARTLTASLRQLGVSPEELDAVFITHEHRDHIAALEVLTRKYPLPVHMLLDCAMRYRNSQAEALCRCLVLYRQPDFTATVGDVTVRAFPTLHDSRASVGYRFEFGGISVGYMTDTGCVTDRMEQMLSGCEAVVLESNHDEQLLLSGPYPYDLKLRIRSNRGHLSNRDAAALAARLAERGTRHFLLAHLSETNNYPAIAYDETASALAGSGATVAVAEPRDITMLVGTVGEPVARAGARMPAAAGGAERSAASAMGGALL